MKKTAALIAALLIGSAAVLALFGCSKSYKIDFGDQKSAFSEVKDSYKAGEKVKFYFPITVTDTSFYFYLDGERIDPGYSAEKGLVISFTMPEHDVKLTYESRNAFIETPTVDEPGILLVDCYSATVGTDGGDCHTELALYSSDDPLTATLEVYELEPGEGNEETCVRYTVPYEAVDRCFGVIDEEGFRSWEGRGDLTCIDGVKYVCKFRNGDGSYTRVSSDEMPEGGIGSMGRVTAVLLEYVKEEYLAN